MIKIHGGDIYTYNKKVIDFSANISPLGVTENIISAIEKSLCEISNYPDVEYRELREAIAEREKVSSESIICGNGAAEIIFNLVQALKPKKVLFIFPSFAEYEQAVNTINAKKRYYYLSEKNNFNLTEDILGFIDNTIDLMFICNPNNPTGTVIKKELLLKIADKCKACNSILLIDECFMDFVYDCNNYSMVNNINSYNNIMILKAFTKLYAIPGLRLGYGISNSGKLVEKIYNCRQPWNVSVVAQAAGIAALRELNLPQKVREYVKTEKDYIMREFSELNIKFFDSKANYILFKANKELDKELLRHNILIRNCSNYKGLKYGYFRIAVKNHADNKKLIDSIKQVMRGNNNG
ncbi:MAG: histidinol-phosphate transaminase [Clostridia bacterium]|nr:histidinol-phosphate transaminase [Clostridia bacterium]